LADEVVLLGGGELRELLALGLFAGAVDGAKRRAIENWRRAGGR